MDVYGEYSGKILKFFSRVLRDTLWGQLLRSKCHFCMKNMDFVWKTPLGVKKGDRSQGESYQKWPTLEGSPIHDNPVLMLGSQKV